MSTSTSATTSPNPNSPAAAPSPPTADGTNSGQGGGTETIDTTARPDKANIIVRRNVLWALGIGLVPVPIVDFVGVTGIQLKMLNELTKLYGVNFSEQMAKKVLASLVAGLGSASVGGLLAASFLKFVPIVGTSLGAISLPIIGGAFTMAVGHVFVSHFESGGTLLNFNPKAIRDHFRAEFEQAKQTVMQMKPDSPATQAAPAPSGRSATA